MPRKINQYSIIRYITDGAIVGMSYLLAAAFSLQLNIWEHEWNNYVFVLLSLAVWYISTNFSHLYTDRRSNKYSEEIIFIVYSLGLYTIMLSSVFFFLSNSLGREHTTNFFLLLDGILFVLLTFTKYIIRKYLHSAISHGKLLDC